jgi:long-chain acyl-CoA synthetase
MAHVDPTREALAYPERDRRLSFGEWNSRVNQLANALHAEGVEHGDKVATVAMNGTEPVTTYFAALKLGAVYVPLNFRLAKSEIQYILDDSDSVVCVYDDELEQQMPSLDDLTTVETYVAVGGDGDHESFESFLSGISDEPPSTVEEEDDAIILYTSGTTGRPKGVVHSHSSIELVTMSFAMLYQYDRERALVITPLYHGSGIHVHLLPILYTEGTGVIVRDFTPQRALELMETEEITSLFGVPAQYNAMLQEATDEYDLSALEKAGYGGAPMAREVVLKVFDTFTDKLYNNYGMSEGGPWGTALRPERHAEKAGSAGLPSYNCDMRLVAPTGTADDVIDKADEVGEILFTGPSFRNMRYYNMPDRTEESFEYDANSKKWYRTGDLGRLDENGYLYFVDRKDDMINSGGENIYPREIEEVLYQHPDVVEAGVVGAPDDEMGQRVVAYIVGDVTTTKLDEFCKDNDDLANFKRPREYVFRDELPRNPSGKLLRRELRD